MKRFGLVGIVTLIGLALFCGSAMAGATMDKIEETGVLKMGFREGSIPFAFIDPKVGKHVGFSVDMAALLAENLGKRFGKKITIKPFTVTPKTRIPMVVNGTIDAEMGSTTYTQKREKVADFSLIFFFRNHLPGGEGLRYQNAGRSERQACRRRSGHDQSDGRTETGR